MVHKGGDPRKGNYFTITPEGKPTVAFSLLQEGLKPLLDKGLLGGLTIPPNAKPIAALIKSGDLAAAQTALAGLKSDGPSGEFKKALLDRFAELRKSKRELFDELVKAEKPWDAYKAGQSYVRCFPKADDVSKVKSAVETLKMNALVKSNLSARTSFMQVASLAFSSKSKSGAADQAGPALDQIVKKYSDTEFGRYASSVK